MSYFHKLNDLLKSYTPSKKPPKLLIGYKMYLELMKERPFFEEVVGSSMEPNKRKFREIKIRVTQDDYQLAIEN